MYSGSSRSSQDQQRFENYSNSEFQASSTSHQHPLPVALAIEDPSLPLHNGDIPLVNTNVPPKRRPPADHDAIRNASDAAAYADHKTVMSDAICPYVRDICATTTIARLKRKKLETLNDILKYQYRSLVNEDPM